MQTQEATAHMEHFFRIDKGLGEEIVSSAAVFQTQTQLLKDAGHHLPGYAPWIDRPVQPSTPDQIKPAIIGPLR